MPPGLIPDDLCNFLGQSYSAPFHYDVDVVVLPAQESVPDIASDDEGPDPQVAGGFRDNPEDRFPEILR